jgi:hypothetical protein
MVDTSLTYTGFVVLARAYVSNGGNIALYAALMVFCEIVFSRAFIYFASFCAGPARPAPFTR